jgi:hypothetical protein
MGNNNKTKKNSSFKNSYKNSSKNSSKNKFAYPDSEQCHPRVGLERPNEGCIPQTVLDEVAKILNVSATRSSIESALKVEPKHEYSFVKALPFDDSKKNQILKEYVRPKQPDDWKSDPDKWLNSLDIDNVMNQYEEAYSEFEFMGPFPIDFSAPDPYKKDGKCLIQEICELRVDEAIKQGTKYIGIIYNLDPHHKGGSHWVALFINLVKHETNYFDSYGNSAPNIKGIQVPQQIQTFMRWIKTQDPSMNLQYNGNRWQYQNSECGMFCLYFIIRMLMGDDFKTFVKYRPPDSFMLDLRDWLFST